MNYLESRESRYNLLQKQLSVNTSYSRQLNFFFWLHLYLWESMCKQIWFSPSFWSKDTIKWGSKFISFKFKYSTYRLQKWVEASVCEENQVTFGLYPLILSALFILLLLCVQRRIFEGFLGVGWALRGPGPYQPPTNPLPTPYQHRP